LVSHLFVTPDLIRGQAFLRPAPEKAAKPRIKSGATVALVLALLPTTALSQISNCDSLLGSREIVIGCTRIDPNTIVVTGTGTSQNISQSGQAIRIIDQTLIERLQSTSVADLLITTPGITVSRNGGPGQVTAVRIRGAEDSQTLVLIDGVRVNDPASPGGAFDFGNLLTGNIDRIEVLRGPNSVPWGSQAIGGVVNIVTAPVNGATLRAEYGFKNSKQLVGQAGGTLGPVTASIGGGYFDDDGISAYKNGTERDGYRQYAGNARVGVAFSEAISLDLRAYYADSKVQFDGFPPPFYSFADTAEFAKTQQLFGYAGLNFAVFDGALKNRLAFTLSNTARDSFDPASGTAASFIARGRVERFEYQGDATISDSLRAVFGIEHETSRFRDEFSRYTTGVTSGYGQAIITPFDGLTLTGGIRVDDHRTYGIKATLSANAAWRVGSGTILRASYGEGFKAPTLFQLYSDYGNNKLRPETAQSYDIGIEQTLLESALTVGLTAFHRDTTNQIDFSFAPRVGRPFGFYDNIARTRAQGIEATLLLRPSDTLTVSANYTLIDAKNRATGQTLLRRPRDSVNADIDWTPRSWLHLGATIRSVSDSRDSDFQTFRPTTLDGYVVAGLRASASIGERFEIYGRIENLFDAQYETVSGYGTLGRNAHVGVRVKI
jgi:vitamin B12 transporter